MKQNPNTKILMGQMIFLVSSIFMMLNIYVTHYHTPSLTDLMPIVGLTLYIVALVLMFMGWNEDYKKSRPSAGTSESHSVKTI